MKAAIPLPPQPMWLKGGDRRSFQPLTEAEGQRQLALVNEFVEWWNAILIASDSMPFAAAFPGLSLDLIGIQGKRPNMLVYRQWQPRCRVVVLGFDDDWRAFLPGDNQGPSFLRCPVNRERLQWAGWLLS